MSLTPDDLQPVDMPASMVVTAESGRMVTVSFAIEDGAGSVSVAMSPSQAVRLAEQLVQAAAGGLGLRRVLDDLPSR